MEVQVLRKPGGSSILGALQALALRGVVLVALCCEAVDESYGGGCVSVYSVTSLGT